VAICLKSRESMAIKSSKKLARGSGFYGPTR
jgi:hypothetical protein